MTEQQKLRAQDNQQWRRSIGPNYVGLFLLPRSGLPREEVQLFQGASVVTPRKLLKLTSSIAEDSSEPKMGRRDSEHVQLLRKEEVPGGTKQEETFELGAE